MAQTKDAMDAITRELGKDYFTIPDIVNNTVNRKNRSNAIPPLWDGRASDRIAETLIVYCKNL